MPRAPSAGRGAAGGRRPGRHGLLQPRKPERGGGRRLAARSPGAVCPYLGQSRRLRGLVPDPGTDWSGVRQAILNAIQVDWVS